MHKTKRMVNINALLAMNATLLTLALLLVCCESALPPSFQKCKRNQNDFNECFKNAVQDAIRQLTVPFKRIGLASVDPMEIPLAVISPGSGSVGFTQKFINMTVFGWSKCICADVNMNFDTKTLTLDCVCPEIHADFQYEFDGRILGIPFSGSGPGNATLARTSCSLVIELEEYKKKGKDHYKIKKDVFSMQPGKMHFHYANLLGADKTTSDDLNDVFNENWEVLFGDVKGGYDEMYRIIFHHVVGRMLAKVSVDDLFG